MEKPNVALLKENAAANEAIIEHLQGCISQRERRLRNLDAQVAELQGRIDAVLETRTRVDREAAEAPAKLEDALRAREQYRRRLREVELEPVIERFRKLAAQIKALKEQGIEVPDSRVLDVQAPA